MSEVLTFQNYILLHFRTGNAFLTLLPVSISSTTAYRKPWAGSITTFKEKAVQTTFRSKSQIFCQVSAASLGSPSRAPGTAAGHHCLQQLGTCRLEAWPGCFLIQLNAEIPQVTGHSQIPPSSWYIYAPKQESGIPIIWSGSETALNQRCSDTLWSSG